MKTLAATSDAKTLPNLQPSHLILLHSKQQKLDSLWSTEGPRNQSCLHLIGAAQ